MTEDIRDILQTTRRIAVVGVSANPARPSHGIMGFLVQCGFEVVGVNPGLAGQSVHGRPVVGTLKPTRARSTWWTCSARATRRGPWWTRRSR